MKKIGKTQIESIKAIANSVREERQSLAGIINAIIDCGEQFSRYSFAFVQRSILNHLRGTAPMEYTGTWFSVGKEGSKNVYRSLSTVEIEQALKEITLQEEIQLAAADLKKSYLRAQSARIHKEATAQVAAAYQRVAAQKAAAEEQKKEQQVEQVTEPAPEAAKEA